MRTRTTKSKATAQPTLTPPSAPATPRSEVVLLAVVGMSPAILTETIWALAHPATKGEAALLPDRVIVITTTAGRREIAEKLFQPSPRFGGRCPWDALRDALQAAGHPLEGRLRFGATPDDIRVFTAAHAASGRSTELEDIRSPADNEAAADFLLEQVRGIVENPDRRLIASLAGGRKTMGALLYACLTLVGRETDRLTHVLVNEPFDTLREFWFPAQPGGPIADRDGRGHDPARARVELAEVPFVPLRNLFQRELGRPAGRFAVLVESCRQEVRRQAGEGVRLTLEQTRPEIEVNGTRVPLAPREHLLLLFLASRAKRQEPSLRSYKEAIAPLDQYREELRRTAPLHNLADWRHGQGLASNFDDDQEVRRALSSLRDKLRAAGGNAFLLAPCLPEKGRFSLEVQPSLIYLK